MKFKAVMKDGECLREFHNIVLSLSKLTKECIIEFEKEHLHFIANEETGTTAPLVWVNMETKLYFTEYNLELLNENQSKIVISVCPVNLSRSLTLLRSDVRQCKLKLLNLQFPCLRVEVDVLTDGTEQTRKIIHNIPITIIPRREWSYYERPQKPNSKLVLSVPLNRFTRGLIDKMKNLSPTIIFYGTSAGEMNLVAETPMVTITTHLTNLDIKDLNPSNEERNLNQIEASCSVDCKKTFILFSALHVPTNEIACGIDDNRLIHMEANIRPGVVIHSILPAICM